ncbi:MAG: Do family serine endopeptidase [Bacteroidales bacterium]
MKFKNIIVYFIVALIGGLVSVYSYVKIAGPAVDEKTYREDHPAWFTSLPDDFEADKFDFTYAAERTVHGVVHVTTTTMRQQQQRRSRDPFYDFFFGPQDNQPEPVQGIGSGVIISEDGYIVTNNHVVANASAIEVTLNDRRSFEAEIIGTDPTTDIALLKIEEKGLPYIEFGDSDELRVGQWVLAVGNPLNLTSTVTAGIVSAKGRGLGVFRELDLAIESFIQTDAAVNRGNSGGALVNLRGELVGIPTLIISPTAAYSGNSFAVPVSIVKKVVEDMLEFGEVQRAVLGVQIRDINSELAREEDLDRIEGVYVAGIVEGGAAEKAGIKEGDVILRIDDTEISSVAELQEQIGRYRPKDKVNVLIKRDNKTQQITATLRNIEGQMDVVTSREAYMGARLREVGDELKNELNISGGVQITELIPGNFMSAGIREGFIITSINNTPVNEPSDIRKILDDYRGGVYVEGIYPDGTVAYYAFGL